MSEGDGVRADLHVKVLDEDVVSRAKARGLDVLVYAPHFTRLSEIRRRAERFADGDLAIIPGREVFTGHWQTRKHLLAVGLEESVPDFITLDGALTEFERQDATVLVPHPTFLTVSLTAGDVARYVDRIDALEVYNPKHLRYHNRRARALAAENGLPGFASSYAHLRRTVGEAWTEFPEPVETAEDLAAAIDAGDLRIAHRGENTDRNLSAVTVGHRLRCVAEFAHLGWENTWQKADRVLLQGTAPTHPGHVAYDGRFDDVRVY